MTFPDPDQRHPVRFPDGTRHLHTVFVNQVLDHPNMHVGAYTYYSDATLTDDVNLSARLAPYLFAGAPEHIHIGKFCQIAEGAQIITQSANHDMSGLTTFPFPIFDPEQIGTYRGALARGEDVVIGNDVWIGRGAILLPKAHVGDGAIIAAGAVVHGAVPAFSVYAGNPAKLVRMRFDEDTVARLLALKWWDWPAQKIARAQPLLAARDLDALEAMD
ncbi:MAG: CatB-related O-acetyltransferase [Pseudomonadota bacterium]